MIDLGIFTRSLNNYFTELTQEGVDFNTPFVVGKDNAVSTYIQEYTAAITITGNFDGAVYVSISREMVSELVQIILGENSDDDELVDMTGEIVNTITGNAREILGDGFNISVPMVIRGRNVHIDLPKLTQPIYIVPARWKLHNFFVCIGLDKVKA